MWQVDFDDAAGTSLYIDAQDAAVLERRNDTWRVFDIAWMLHIMDYTGREDFNHPLIVTVATGVAWLALSGLILLFRAFRRSDVAWITGPFERLAERRRSRGG